MENVVVLITVPALMALGFIAMRRLDDFLSHNRIAIEQASCRQENALRIAFSNPLVAGAVSEPLERLCKLHPDIEIHLYVGEADAILTQLAANGIDMAFLPRPAEKDAAEPWGELFVSLPQGALRGGDLSILPLEGGGAIQWVTWRKAACAGRSGELMTLLETELHAPSGSAGRRGATSDAY